MVTAIKGCDSQSKKASAAEAKKAKDDAETKAQEEAQAKEDAMFQALLNSQREILAKLDFGGSNSDLQFVEGPDNLPLVSPHNSGEFNLYNCSDEYDYRYEQYLPQDVPPQYHYHQYHHQPHHQQSYHRPPQEQLLPPYHHQHHHHQAFAPPETTSVDDGIGDDRFILEEIEIESSGDSAEEKDDEPAIFDIGVDPALHRRKRDMEQEMVQTIKKRRNGSHHGQRPSYDSLLPDMNDSSSSLDFASLHSTTAEPATTTATTTQMWKPRERKVQDKLSLEEEEDSKPKARSTVLQPTMSMEEDDDTTKNTRPSPPRRSSRSLWKPRQRRSSEMSLEDQRSMWKPRNRNSTTSHQDSVTSLHVDDLDVSEQKEPFQVSLTEGDIQRRCPSRTSSNDSTASVHSLSEALQQSLGSTKSIQEWDKKMGLKRSHSKTMRQSAKTRQQLLALLQTKEGEEQQQQQQQPGETIPRKDHAATIQEGDEDEACIVVEL